MKYLYIIFVVILSACQSAPDRDVKSPDTAQARESSDKKPPAVPEEPIIKEPEPTVSKRQDRFVGKTVTGTKFIVEKVKNEEDERHYVLNGEGFKFAKAVNLPNHAPVKDLLTADLDG
ncbi:MAG TPA: hypothetical protein ENK85_01925, partial [Saprospiraceae bacterium]|nr:hypothetical protein [Saprospiraceae bacterium]